MNSGNNVQVLQGQRRGKRSLIITQAIIFIINPFLALLSSLYHLCKSDGKEIRLVCYFFISLFFGFVAFTQFTEVGDISRTYESIVNGHELVQSNFLLFVLQSKHILYDLINEAIYVLGHDERYASLFWIFFLFYATFLSIENILEYTGDVIKIKSVSVLIFVTIFCFINFAEVTELMKQGVATAFVLYSFTSLLVGKKLRGFLVFLIALNIHFSVLFYLPLLLAKKIPSWTMLLLLLFSFTLRSFGLMEFLSSLLSRIPGVGDLFLLGEIANATEAYQVQIESFFQSSSPFFQFAFWTFFIVTIITFFYKRRSTLVNCCMIMLCVLNLSYSDNHNYTRLLTMLFPFYICLFFEISSIKIRSSQKILNYMLVLCSFLINARFFFSKINSVDYGTSYLDNSLLHLFLYPSFMYLT